MKKAAPLKEKNNEVKSIVEEKKKDEEIVIPPDVLEENTDNIEEKSHLSDDESQQEGLHEEKTEEKIEEEPSFYERVTGESPIKHTFEEDPNDEESPQIENVNRKLFFLGGFVFLLTVVVATLVGFYILNNSKQSDRDLAEKSSEEEVEVSPTPTITQINKSEWTFEVLNGSGVKGAAAEAQTQIEALGYTVDSIGNASNVDSTEVYISDEKDRKIVEKILPELVKDFGDLTIQEKIRESNAKIVIVLGSN